MDDMLPNDGSFYQPSEPEDQALARTASINKAQAAAPMLDDLITRKREEIAHMDTTDTINVNPETDPVAFMRAWYGVQQVKAYALADLAYLESLLPDRR